MTDPRIPAGSSRPSLYTITSGLDLLEDWAVEATQPQKNTVYLTLFAVADKTVFTAGTVIDDPASPLEFFVLAKNDIVVKIRIESMDSFAILYIGPSDAAPGLDVAPATVTEILSGIEISARF
jgi:hypothetical protein